MEYPITRLMKQPKKQELHSKSFKPETAKWTDAWLTLSCKGSTSGQNLPAGWNPWWVGGPKLRSPNQTFIFLKHFGKFLGKWCKFFKPNFCIETMKISWELMQIFQNRSFHWKHWVPRSLYTEQFFVTTPTQPQLNPKVGRKWLYTTTITPTTHHHKLNVINIWPDFNQNLKVGLWNQQQYKQ